MNFARSFANEPIVSYRVAAAEHWFKNERFSSELVQVLNFFEEVGLLVTRGYLDPDDTWELFSSVIFPLFKSCEKSILDEQRDDPNTFKNLVKLYLTIAEIEKKQGNGLACEPSADQIDEFWQEELKVRPGTRPRPKNFKAKKLREYIHSISPSIGD